MSMPITSKFEFQVTTGLETFAYVSAGLLANGSFSVGGIQIVVHDFIRR